MPTNHYPPQSSSSPPAPAPIDPPVAHLSWRGLFSEMVDLGCKHGAVKGALFGAPYASVTLFNLLVLVLMFSDTLKLSDFLWTLVITMLLGAGFGALAGVVLGLVSALVLASYRCSASGGSTPGFLLHRYRLPGGVSMLVGMKQ